MFTEAAPALHETIQLYAKVGTAIVEAKEQRQDPFTAIEALMSWEAFAKSVAAASELAATRDADSLGLVADYYGQLRRYAPSLLEMFSFQAAPAVKPLIDSIEVLRQMNQTGARLLPANVPTAFVRRRWAPYVFEGDVAGFPSWGPADFLSWGPP